MNDPRRSMTNADNIRAWSSVSSADVEQFGDEGDFAHRHLLTPALLELPGDVRGNQLPDAGAGHGFLARMLAKRGAAVTAIDLTEGPFRYIVEREEREPLGITCLQLDLSTMDQFESVFDVVIANMVSPDIPAFEG